MIDLFAALDSNPFIPFLCDLSQFGTESAPDKRFIGALLTDSSLVLSLKDKSVKNVLAYIDSGSIGGEVSHQAISKLRSAYSNSPRGLSSFGIRPAIAQPLDRNGVPVSGYAECAEGPAAEQGMSSLGEGSGISGFATLFQVGRLFPLVLKFLMYGLMKQPYFPEFVPPVAGILSEDEMGWTSISFEQPLVWADESRLVFAFRIDDIDIL